MLQGNYKRVRAVGGYEGRIWSIEVVYYVGTESVGR